LTGTPSEIAAVAKSYRVFFRKTGDGPDYLVDHSSAMIVMDPRLAFAGLLSANLSLDEMAERLEGMMRDGN
jgi:protein SCO1